MSFLNTKLFYHLSYHGILNYQLSTLHNDPLFFNESCKIKYYSMYSNVPFHITTKYIYCCSYYYANNIKYFLFSILSMLNSKVIKLIDGYKIILNQSKFLTKYLRYYILNFEIITILGRNDVLRKLN